MNKGPSQKNVDHEAINMKIIILKPLTSVSLEQQMRLREIRNEPSVRATALTDHEISIEEHFQWISRLRTDKKQVVFAILNEAETPIGVISVNAINFLHSIADWTFYLTESARGGLGTAIEWHFIEFVFSKLNIQKLNGEVLEGNNYVIAHHSKFFFVEEGFRRSNVVKNGVRIGVHFVGLTKSDWLDNRKTTFENYENVISKFNIRICFEENVNESLTTI